MLHWRSHKTLCVLCEDESLLEMLNKLNVVRIKEELTQDDADVEDIWVKAACTDSRIRHRS